MKKIVRISITALLLLTLAPVVVYGIYLLWDQGVVPGNPRALSPDAMLEAVSDQARYSSISEKDLCITPDPANFLPDRHGVDGFGGAPYPELYAQTFLLEKKDRFNRSRVPFFKGRNFFASHGFYRERERILETDQGPRRAREYQLTWRGYVAQSQHKPHCFRVGRRGVDTIESYEKLPQKIAENDAWKITYQTKLQDVPDWVNDPRARSLFPDLASMLQPTIDSVVVVRGGDGWIPGYVARLQGAIRNADSKGNQRSQDASLLLQMAQAPKITQTEIDDALSNYLSSSAWDTKDRACFNPRIARGGDDHALAKKLSRTKSLGLEAIYYDVDTKHRGKYGYQRLAGQLHIWHALEKSGFASLEPIPPGEYQLRGKKTKINTMGGVKYTINRDAYAALQAAGRGLCIPVGKTHIGLVAVQPFPPGRLRIIARGTVTNPPDLAKKIAKSLPALNHVINNGFPITSKRLYAVPFMAYKRLLNFAALRRPVSTLLLEGIVFARPGFV